MIIPAAKVIAIAAVTLGAVALGSPAHACSCAELPSPCAPGDDVVIFTGRVTSAAPFMTSMIRHELRVRETFRGALDAKTVAVTSQASIDRCGFPFEQGEEYLVFAWKDDSGALFTGLCTLTRRVAAGGDFLPLLREMKNGAPRTRLIGSIAEVVRRLDGQYKNVDYQPLEDVRVTASGAGGRFATSTDRNGGFRFVGLPQGTYAIEPALTGRFALVGSPARVTFDSCFASVTLLAVRTPLDGVVLDAAGRPLTEPVHVGVIPAADSRAEPPDHGPATYVISGRDGAWRFDGLPPGRYYVGTNLFESPDNMPYQPYWHPVPGRPSEPAMVTIAHDHPVRLELRVGPRFERTELRGTVVDAAGAPVPLATMLLTDVESRRDYLFAAYADEDGRFSVPAVRGRAYQIVALAPDGAAGLRRSVPQAVADDRREVTIVIP
jgi:hypothetical protein